VREIINTGYFLLLVLFFSLLSLLLAQADFCIRQFPLYEKRWRFASSHISWEKEDSFLASLFSASLPPLSLLAAVLHCVWCTFLHCEEGPSFPSSPLKIENFFVSTLGGKKVVKHSKPQEHKVLEVSITRGLTIFIDSKKLKQHFTYRPQTTTVLSCLTSLLLHDLASSTASCLQRTGKRLRPITPPCHDLQPTADSCVVLQLFRDS